MHSSSLELRPTPESRRIAAFTAIGAITVAALAVFLAESNVRGAWVSWFAVAAAIATLLPAVNALTTRVAADDREVSVKSFGRTRRFDWPAITSVLVIERRASVPDGTEYHWLSVQRSPHLVAVPCLELVDGRVCELPMLASRATPDASRVAESNAHQLASARPASAKP